MNEGEAIVQLVVAAGYDAATPGNHDRNYKYDRLAQINSVETADAAQPNAQIDALVAQLDSENTALLEQVLNQSEQGLLSEATVFYPSSSSETRNDVLSQSLSGLQISLALL